MDHEKWLPAPGFEGLYEVSDQGRVRSLDRIIVKKNGQSCILRGVALAHWMKNDYPAVTLSINGIRHSWYIHRLVLVAFDRFPTDGEEVCHGNGIRTDNRLENLRWDNHLSNVGDTIKHGRHKSIGSYNGGRTHCHRGHVFDEANTIIRPTGRSCRKCRRMKERERYHAAKTRL